MTLAPIALFVYNRPTHTSATITALMANAGAAESELTIFCDGARTAADLPMVQAVRDICKSATGFKKLTIIEHEQNIGLARNIIGGISKILETEMSVICLEDDLITSKGFLHYMNQALEYYEHRQVFSISAYSPPIEVYKNYPYSTYAVMRNSSWGWATWKNKWQKTDWTVAGFNAFMASEAQRHAFEAAGNDTVMMLLKQQQGKIHSWSIRFNFAAFLSGEPNIYPVKSLIENRGIDGSGTNMKKSAKYATSTTEEINSHLFIPNNEIDSQIALRFRRFYNTSLLRRLINLIKIKRYLSGLR